ncbi:amino acid ABC transporter permease [Paenibacillus woosongensis]|uniref:Amino acid ABC transporter permease n=1 Tax=Paenibacillus woosongensis TaxID=307580 RepID=A0AA95L0U4_9BACL|nr:amino acid ABC transporter permease [Paenibacillus woosongensis]WHX48834.1 amino acid ABC transporter permease [Paenibacillus woosongensis]GIP58734.1 cysteine ABC transporter permease [Paenibacillus woosongensis]
MNDRLVQIFIDSLLPLLKAGVAFTIPLTLITFGLGMLVAILTALARLSKWTLIRQAAKFYVWVIRGTPLLVQLFIIFYGLPSVGITLKPFSAAVIGFTLSVGAYGSEIVRAAILSIEKGQWEAAYSLGMSRIQALYYVILPQAARVSVPPLGNSFISLVKDTSLAFTVTYAEMFRKAQEITSVTYEPLLVYSEVALIYLLFSTVLSALQSHMEKRLDRFAVK